MCPYKYHVLLDVTPPIFIKTFSNLTNVNRNHKWLRLLYSKLLRLRAVVRNVDLNSLPSLPPPPWLTKEKVFVLAFHLDGLQGLSHQVKHPNTVNAGPTLT